jgi:hypothetical protein
MTDTSITTIEKDITWIRAHILASLLAIALIAGSIIGGIGLFEGLIEKHDARVAATQLQKEGVDTATTAALMAQLQQDRTANTVRDTAQTALIQTLVTQMAQQRAQTAKQIVTDSTLSARAAADRLISQTGVSPSQVTVINDAVTMDLPLTHIVVTNLDQFRQSQSDVTNLQGQLGAQQILTTDAKSELSTANQIITADKVELIATIKADNSACKVEVDAQSKKDRKRGIWASIASFAGGLIVRGLL